MLQKYKDKREQGFTIVEVLIVLAIAGLIILIVLLAVPALQRNQRNTARRNDVSRIGGAVQEFSNNNNGRTPGAGDVGDVVANAGDLSQYETGDISINAPGGAVGALTDSQEMIVQVGVVCDGTTGGVTDTGAGSRNVAIQFAVETTGGVDGVCQNV